jgi:predicted nucleic acid-binding protein
MSYILKVFLDASVFNFYFDGKQGTKRRDTIKFFDAVEAGRYEVYSSLAVIEELEEAPPQKYTQMIGLFEKYVKNKILTTNAEIERLANLYVEKNIIPVNSMTDALHIATATVNHLDFVVSCNMGHIVKQKTMIGTGFINFREGYRSIGLSSTMEVIAYDI